MTSGSQSDWLRVRAYLQEHRHALAVDAAQDYPAGARFAGTPLLAAPGWQPAEPIPLREVNLELSSPAALTGFGDGAGALDRGQVRVWCLGLGTDPLTYATDLLTVAVIDSRVFDDLFSLSPRSNAEGSVLAAREFAAHVIDRVVTSEPVQAAGAAVLRLAWRHRETLLS